MAREVIRSFHGGTEFRAARAGGRVTATISTSEMARDGAIVLASGWHLEAYRRNPVVLFTHDDRATMPIARTTEVGVQGSDLVATAEFDQGDDFAMRILSKIRRGFLNATSVRWIPLRSERRRITVDGVARDVLVFTEAELVEWSVVAIPADPGALISGRSAGATGGRAADVGVRAYVERLLRPASPGASRTRPATAAPVRVPAPAHYDAAALAELATRWEGIGALLEGRTGARQR